MKLKLSTWILIAMPAGIGVGWMGYERLPVLGSAKGISLFTDVFLRLSKMDHRSVGVRNPGGGDRAHG